MNKKELKDKYAPLIAEISKIMGVEKPTKVLRLCAVIDSYLGKPTDILKLCEAVDSFFQPLEKRIVELEQKNKRLTRELSHEQAAYDIHSNSYNDAKKETCNNCKHLTEPYKLCHYSHGDEDYDCNGRKWEAKEK